MSADSRMNANPRRRSEQQKCRRPVLEPTLQQKCPSSFFATLAKVVCDWIHTFCICPTSSSCRRRQQAGQVSLGSRLFRIMSPRCDGSNALQMLTQGPCPDISRLNHTGCPHMGSAPLSGPLGWNGGCIRTDCTTAAKPRLPGLPKPHQLGCWSSKARGEAKQWGMVTPAGYAPPSIPTAEAIPRH